MTPGRSVSGALLFLLLWVSTTATSQLCRNAVYNSIPDELLGKRQQQHLQKSGPLEAFQVTEPVLNPVPPGDKHGCVHTQLLMQHVFAFSYGHPFVGL